MRHHTLTSAAALAGSLLVAPQAQAQTPAPDEAPEAAPQLTPPALLNDVVARYPANLSGPPLVAVVRISLDAQGQIEGAQLVSLTPPPAPERRAQVGAHVIALVMDLRFSPARREGAPTPITFPVSLDLIPDAPAGTPQARAATTTALALADALRPSAQTPPAPEAPPQKVRTRGTREQQAAASDLTFKVGQLREVPRRSAEQFMTLAPGLALSNHGGEGHPSAVFLRGFDAREGQDLAMSVMGVPINDPSNPHGHGFADTHFIIPELIDTVRVIEGPFDPRQGDYAVAGSVDFTLKPEAEGVQLGLELGQFNTQRAFGVVARAHGAGMSWAAADARAGDGFGPNRAHASARVMAGHEARLGESSHMRAWFGSYIGRFDSAGVVRARDVETHSMPCALTAEDQRLCTYDPNQGGQMGRHGGGVTFSGRGADDARWQQSLFGTVRRMQSRENYTGFLSDVRSDGPQRGDGLESIYESVMIGASGAYTMAPVLWERAHEVELGYQARFDSAEVFQRRLRATGGAPYAATLDQAVSVASLGAYVATRWQLLERVALSAGARADTFSFQVRDRARPSVDRQGARLGEDATSAQGVALSPRVSVRWDLARGLGWVSAWGRGARSSEAAALSQGEFAPFARTQAVETGLVAQHRAGRWQLDGRLLAFETYVDRDLLFDEVAGRNVFQGASHRFGAAALARARYGSALDVLASASYTEAYRPGADDPWWQLNAGPRLPYIPRWVGRIDATGRRDVSVAQERVTLSAALGLSWMSARPLPLNQLGQSQQRLDGALRARWRDVELGVEVLNALDQPYREAEFYYASSFERPDRAPSEFPAVHFIAGTPRAVLVTLGMRLGGPADDEPERL